MIKLGRFALSALALVSLPSLTASATTICETEVPSGSTAGTRHRFQTMSICAATNDGKASGNLLKISGSNSNSSGTYSMEVERLAGSNNAKIHIVDAIVGNIITDNFTGSPCTAIDSSINGTGASFICETSLTQQLYMYVIVS